MNDIDVNVVLLKLKHQIDFPFVSDALQTLPKEKDVALALIGWVLSELHILLLDPDVDHLNLWKKFIIDNITLPIDFYHKSATTRDIAQLQKTLYDAYQPMNMAVNQCYLDTSDVNERQRRVQPFEQAYQSRRIWFGTLSLVHKIETNEYSTIYFWVGCYAKAMGTAFEMQSPQPTGQPNQHLMLVRLYSILAEIPVIIEQL